MVSQCALVCFGLLSGVLGKPNPEHFISSSNQRPSTDWASKVAALQSQIEARMQARKSRHYLRGATSTTSAAPTTTEATLMMKIVDLQREMCSDPEKQGRDFCKQFVGEPLETTTAAPTAHPWPELVATQAKLEAHAHRLQVRKAQRQTESRRAALTAQGALLKKKIAALAEKRRAWDRDLAARASALGRELCMEPERKGYDACKFFLQDSQEPIYIRRLAVEVSHQRWGESASTSTQEELSVAAESEEVMSWMVVTLRAGQLIFNMVCLAMLWSRVQQRKKAKAQLQAARPLLQC